MKLTALTHTVPVGADENAAVVHLAGQLDTDTAPQLRERLIGLLGDGHRYRAGPGGVAARSGHRWPRSRPGHRG